MTEKAEWEVVDADAPPQDTRQTLHQLMKNMLGPWWRWKVAGVVIAAGAALMFFLTVTAIFILGVMAAAIVSVSVGKVRQWFRARPDTTVRRRY